MEKFLPTVRSMPIVIRSLYLHRNDEFIRQAYPGGLKAIYSHMYPLGAFEGYYQVAQSFYHSSFFRQALKVFRLAENEYPRAAIRYKGLLKSQEKDGSPDNGQDSVRDPRWTIRSIRAKISRIQKWSGKNPRSRDKQKSSGSSAK